MKASQLIEVLQKAVADHGDCEVRGHWEGITEPVHAVVISQEWSRPRDGVKVPAILIDVDSIGGGWSQEKATVLFEDPDAD